MSILVIIWDTTFFSEKMEEEVPDPIKCAFNPAWKELNELHAAAPYGLSDAKVCF